MSYEYLKVEAKKQLTKLYSHSADTVSIILQEFLRECRVTFDQTVERNAKHYKGKNFEEQYRKSFYTALLLIIPGKSWDRFCKENKILEQDKEEIETLLELLAITE